MIQGVPSREIHRTHRLKYPSDAAVVTLNPHGDAESMLHAAMFIWIFIDRMRIERYIYP